MFKRGLSMAKKDKKVEVVDEPVEEVVEEPVKEVVKEVKTFKDSQGRTWELDDEGNRVKKVVL
jgi:transposase-like protein